MLFKKTAEVFPAEANTGRNIIQRKFFRVMFIDVSDDFPDRIIIKGSGAAVISGREYTEKYRIKSASISKAVPSERIALVLSLLHLYGSYCGPAGTDGCIVWIWGYQVV